MLQAGLIVTEAPSLPSSPFLHTTNHCGVKEGREGGELVLVALGSRTRAKARTRPKPKKKNRQETNRKTLAPQCFVHQLPLSCHLLSRFA